MEVFLKSRLMKENQVTGIENMNLSICGMHSMWQTHKKNVKNKFKKLAHISTKSC